MYKGHVLPKMPTFIHRRDAVFQKLPDYARLGLRKRSEGRLKTYASATDARTWQLSEETRRQCLRDIVEINFPIKVIHLGAIIPIEVLLKLICNSFESSDLPGTSFSSNKTQLAIEMGPRIGPALCNCGQADTAFIYPALERPILTPQYLDPSKFLSTPKDPTIQFLKRPETTPESESSIFVTDNQNVKIQSKVVKIDAKEMQSYLRPERSDPKDQAIVSQKIDLKKERNDNVLLKKPISPKVNPKTGGNQVLPKKMESKGPNIDPYKTRNQIPLRKKDPKGRNEIVLPGTSKDPGLDPKQGRNQNIRPEQEDPRSSCKDPKIAPDNCPLERNVLPDKIVPNDPSNDRKNEEKPSTSNADEDPFTKLQNMLIEKALQQKNRLCKCYDSIMNSKPKKVPEKGAQESWEWSSDSDVDEYFLPPKSKPVESAKPSKIATKKDEVRRKNFTQTINELVSFHNLTSPNPTQKRDQKVQVSTQKGEDPKKHQDNIYPPPKKLQASFFTQTLNEQVSSNASNPTQKRCDQKMQVSTRKDEDRRKNQNSIYPRPKKLQASFFTQTLNEQVSSNASNRTQKRCDQNVQTSYQDYLDNVSSTLAEEILHEMKLNSFMPTGTQSQLVPRGLPRRNSVTCLYKRLSPRILDLGSSIFMNSTNLYYESAESCDQSKVLERKRGGSEGSTQDNDLLSKKIQMQIYPQWQHLLSHIEQLQSLLANHSSPWANSSNTADESRTKVSSGFDWNQAGSSRYANLGSENMSYQNSTLTAEEGNNILETYRGSIKFPTLDDIETDCNYQREETECGRRRCNCGQYWGECKCIQTRRALENGKKTKKPHKDRTNCGAKPKTPLPSAKQNLPSGCGKKPPTTPTTSRRSSLKETSRTSPPCKKSEARFPTTKGTRCQTLKGSSPKKDKSVVSPLAKFKPLATSSFQNKQRTGASTLPSSFERSRARSLSPKQSPNLVRFQSIVSIEKSTLPTNISTSHRPSYNGSKFHDSTHNKRTPQGKLTPNATYPYCKICATSNRSEAYPSENSTQYKELPSKLIRPTDCSTTTTTQTPNGPCTLNSSTQYKELPSRVSRPSKNAVTFQPIASITLKESIDPLGIDFSNSMVQTPHRHSTLNDRTQYQEIPSQFGRRSQNVPSFDPISSTSPPIVDVLDSMVQTPHRRSTYNDPYQAIPKRFGRPPGSQPMPSTSLKESSIDPPVVDSISNSFEQTPHRHSTYNDSTQYYEIPSRYGRRQQNVGIQPMPLTSLKESSIDQPVLDFSNSMVQIPHKRSSNQHQAIPSQFGGPPRNLNQFQPLTPSPVVDLSNSSVQTPHRPSTYNGSTQYQELPSRFGRGTQYQELPCQFGRPPSNVNEFQPASSVVDLSNASIQTPHRPSTYNGSTQYHELPSRFRRPPKNGFQPMASLAETSIDPRAIDIPNAIAPTPHWSTINDSTRYRELPQVCRVPKKLVQFQPIATSSLKQGSIGPGINFSDTMDPMYQASNEISSQTPHQYTLPSSPSNPQSPIFHELPSYNESSSYNDSVPYREFPHANFKCISPFCRICAPSPHEITPQWSPTQSNSPVGFDPIASSSFNDPQSINLSNTPHRQTYNSEFKELPSLSQSPKTPTWLDSIGSCSLKDSEAINFSNQFKELPSQLSELSNTQIGFEPIASTPPNSPQAIDFSTPLPNSQPNCSRNDQEQEERLILSNLDRSLISISSSLRKYVNLRDILEDVINTPDSSDTTYPQYHQQSDSPHQTYRNYESRFVQLQVPSDGLNLNLQSKESLQSSVITLIDKFLAKHNESAKNLGSKKVISKYAKSNASNQTNLSKVVKPRGKSKSPSWRTSYTVNRVTIIQPQIIQITARQMTKIDPKLKPFEGEIELSTKCFEPEPKTASTKCLEFLSSSTSSESFVSGTTSSFSVLNAGLDKEPLRCYFRTVMDSVPPRYFPAFINRKSKSTTNIKPIGYNRKPVKTSRSSSNIRYSRARPWG